MRNLVAAENYCDQYYDPADPKSRCVYDLLFELCNSHEKPTEKLRFINKFGYKMNHEMVDFYFPKKIKVLNHFSSELHLSILKSYFEKLSQTLQEERNSAVVKLSLLKAHKIQIENVLRIKENKRLLLNEDRLCSVCLKRIANNVFHFHPDESISHAYCHKK